MKKGRKVLNRILSLLLCLVMASGMFAHMGMEATAAEDVDVIVYESGGGTSIAGTQPLDAEIKMYITPSQGSGESVYYNSSHSRIDGKYSGSDIESLEIETDGYDLQYIYKPGQDYNPSPGKASWVVTVWPACKYNITVVDHDGNPVANQDVKVKWGGMDYGTVTTDSQGKATHWKVRWVGTGVEFSTSSGGRTHSVKSPSWQSKEHNITLQIKKIQTVSVNLKNANGELLTGASVADSGKNITFSDSDNNGTYTADLEVGEVYNISAYAQGYDTKAIGNMVVTDGMKSIDLTLDATIPSVYPERDEINVSVGENAWIMSMAFGGQGITYTSEIENPDIASYDGSYVTGLKSGTTNLHFHAVVGNVKRTRTIPITVVKADPTVSVTAPTNVIYGKYEGNFTLKSNVAGTFTINGKEIAVSANTDATEKFVNIITESQAVGAYDLAWTFSPAETDKYNSKTGSVQYQIGERDLSKDGKIEFDAPDFVYDGTAKTLNGVEVSVDGTLLQPGVDYTVDYKNNVKAGNTATVEVTGKGNYTGTISKAFNIAKAKLSVANVTADNRTYDGTKLVQLSGVELNNIATGDKLSDIIDFTGATAMISDKDAGKYASVNNLSGISLKDTENYEFTIPATEVALKENVIISPAKVKIVDVIIDLTKTYDGTTTVNITDKGNVSGVIKGDAVVVVEGTARYEDKNVGDDKPVTFSGFSIMGELGTVISNYELAEQPSSQTASITKKSLHMIEGSANVNDKLYDGTTGAEFSKIPELVQNDLIENDQVVLDYSTAPVFNEIGSADEERSVKVTTNLKITGADAGNYSLQIPEVSAMIKNYTAINGTDYSVNSNEWINEDFVITAGNGCYVSEGSTVDSEWAKSLTVTCEDNNSNVGTKAFYVKNANGKISRVVNDKNAEYKIDKIAPTGTVTFTEAQTPWTEFIETISFGLFYKDAQEVVITSQDQDGLSGVASVEWYESLNKGMTLEEVEAITNWKEYKGNLIVALEDTKKFVYYVKITDYAGNVTYLSTDGAVYDITNPAITGIVNGETYYTSQVANVSDVNLDTITFNGNSVSIVEGGVTTITLEGNVDATYTITAVDKAKNTTTVTITMKPLSELSGDITDNNVALSDEKELEKSEEILEEALKEENLSKLVEGEEEAIREKLTVIQNLLQDIDEVKQVIKLLENLPGAYLKDGINPYVSDSMDDEEQKLYSAVKAAYKAYDKLSSHQQSLINTGLKHNLSDLRKILTDYRIIDSNSKVWVYDTNGTLTFTANGPVVRFTAAFVDGKKVPADEMKVTKGSTVVELDAGYLYSLGLGDHTFQMEYEDGKTDVVEFSIVTMEEWNAMLNQQSGSNKTGGVATGDSANILLWGAALILGATGLVVANKKRKNEEL